MPAVSVIMPVYNGERYLAQAIDSILGQTFTDFELLIVDDCSQDGSAEIIRAFQTQDSRIRGFRLAANAGVGAARNHALKAAKGDYVTPMDCDDISVATRLQQQVDFLDANPAIGALGGNCRVVSGDLKALLFRMECPQSHAISAMRNFYGDSFVQATIMYRRKFLVAVDGYDPNLRVAEDLDLVLRLLFETRIKFANLPVELLIYRRHQQSTTKSSSQTTWAMSQQLRHRALERLWNSSVAADTMDRFMVLYRREKLSWSERRAAKKDMRRLIEALIARNWVEPEDKPLLINEMNRRLEQASPRRWQQFMHWRRLHTSG